MRIPIIIDKEDNWYVSKDLISGVASQGHTIEESMANLKEALELFYENSDWTNAYKDEDVMLATMEV